MCGIFGLMVNNKSTKDSQLIIKSISTLFKLSESRGKEAAGISIKSAGGIRLYKRPISASKMICEGEYHRFLESSLMTDSFLCIGHSRLATNGAKDSYENNQPVVVDQLVGVHNGIICNVKELLQNNPHLSPKSDLDSEILFQLIESSISSEYNPVKLFAEVFEKIEGTVSFSFLSNKYKAIFFGTNNGSLYYVNDISNKSLVFASEQRILEKYLQSESGKKIFKTPEILPVFPNSLVMVEEETMNQLVWSTGKSVPDVPLLKATELDGGIVQHLAKDLHSNQDFQYKKFHRNSVHLRKLDTWINQIHQLKRCNQCILPETHPYIYFDEQGVCNYCRNYFKQKLNPYSELLKYADKHRRKNGSDCIVALSGGRDSCYALHYVKKVLNLNPIAYTYDWGLVTDLARRNQARMCGSLGVEHIIVAADVEEKRNYVKKNVSAWLKNPDIGMVPLFMAGDKMFLSNANKLRDQLGIKSLIFGMNELENTDFKEGYCGINRIKKDADQFYDLSVAQKIKMITYYAHQYIANPGYINASLWDTFYAFFAYYMIKHDYLFLFKYLKWDEKEIESTLIREYNWETSPDTPSTWRIGDGTASFYNYIYYTITGFTESDSFRSNQIREGQLTRAEALEIVNAENKPRYDSIEWYCDKIKLDVNTVIDVVDRIPRRF